MGQSFQKCIFIHLLRNHNQMVDTLASLASVWDGLTTMPMKPLVLLKSGQLCYKSIRVIEVRVDHKPWFYDIQQYLDKREYPVDESEKDKTIIRK